MDPFFAALQVTRRWPVWARYTTTAILVLFVFLISLLVGEHLEKFPFLLFLPVIIGCALLFDRGNGIVATTLSALGIIYLLIPPENELAIQDPAAVLAIVLFTAIGVSISLLLEALHQTFVQLAASHARLETLSEERAVLLRELTHRMRNHLATISSLLRLQAKAVGEPSAMSALRAAADRVHVLARVHERLVLRGDSAVVDSREYITDLCGDLRASLVDARLVALRDSVEGHPIGVQKAVAIGLIINELLMNALKYAFRDEKAGVVNISFKRSGPIYLLIVSDNGVGIGGEQQGTGMGLNLVRTLAAQFGGELEIRDAQPGTSFVVSLPVEAAAKPKEPRSFNSSREADDSRFRRD